MQRDLENSKRERECVCKRERVGEGHVQERKWGRVQGTNILANFRWLGIFGRKKATENNLIFGDQRWATENNSLFSAAIKTA
jgi:hypothetical protein